MNKPLLPDPRKNFLVPQGEFELERCPRDERLQAWDAGDEYLLGYLDELQMLSQDSRTWTCDYRRTASLRRTSANGAAR